jgi:hypothetical protein
MGILKGLHGSTGFLGLTHRGRHGILGTWSGDDRETTVLFSDLLSPESLLQSQSPSVPGSLDTRHDRQSSDTVHLTASGTQTTSAGVLLYRSHTVR